MSQFEFPSAVRWVLARLSGNVGQPNQVIGDYIAGHQVERRPGAGEEWLATTKHDGAEVQSILIDKTGFGQALRQGWSANVNLARQVGLELAYQLLEVIRDKRGVWANGLERARHDPLRLAPPHHRELAVVRVPIRRIFVPITHDFVGAATVDDARQATHELDEVTEGRGRRRAKLGVVDVAIEGLIQSIDKFCHARTSLQSSSV